MADFEDEFTEAADTLLKNHTPDVGTGWLYTGTNDDAAAVFSDDDHLRLGAGNVGTSGVGYTAIDPELSSADQQVWFRLKSLNPGLDAGYVAVRVTDEDNLTGWRLFGTGSLGRRLTNIVNGITDDLVTTQGVDEEWIKVKAEGDQVTMFEGGTGAEPVDPESDTNWNVVGSAQTVTERQTEATVAVVNRAGDNATVPWIDSFRASAIGGGADVTGDGSPQAQDATATGTGIREVTGSGTPSAQAATASGTGEREVTGSATVQSQDATATGSGGLGGEVSGSGSASAQDATATGSGSREIVISAAVQARDATASGTGEREITGSATVQSQSATASGTDIVEVIQNRLPPHLGQSRLYRYLKS